MRWWESARRLQPIFVAVRGKIRKPRKRKSHARYALFHDSVHAAGRGRRARQGAVERAGSGEKCAAAFGLRAVYAGDWSAEAAGLLRFDYSRFVFAYRNVS